ncbi:MAG: metallophosphoesterase [Candidatus Aminicenantales bacterium]
MADSHDNLPAIKQAVRFFGKANCRLVIHAGDFVAPFAARELEALGCPVRAVFGNCDGEKQGLIQTLHPFGEIAKAPLRFSAYNHKFLVTHLHFKLESYLNSGKEEIIIFGHTHRPEIRKKNNVLLLNPGETGGWLSGQRTVALLDPTTMRAEIIYL